MKGFTLVEVLLAVTLSAALVLAGGAWLHGLQRSAQATRSQCARIAALATTTTRLRDDLIHATLDQPIGSRDAQGAWLLTIAGSRGAARDCVAWSVREGKAIRAARPWHGGRWNDEVIAVGIDRLEILTSPTTPPLLRLTAGSETLTTGILPGVAHAP